jgi:hypothetical protein
MPATLKDELNATRMAWTYFHETQHVHHGVEIIPREHIHEKRRTDLKQVFISAWSVEYSARHKAIAAGYRTHYMRLRRANIRSQFHQLSRRWKQETAFQSNITKKAMHPAYQRIIGMGREVVPLILEEFRNGRLDDWFWALTAITAENPITEDIAGNVERMAEAWLRWGKAKGYLNDLN